MSNVAELPIIGHVTVKALANVRQGAPTLSAPVIYKLAAGDTVEIGAFTAGDTIQGNANWFRLATGGYLWSGACGRVVAPGSDMATPSGSRAPQALALDRIPLVVDLYHGDGVTSFAEAKTAGVVGIIHKATTGATGQDDAYRGRRQPALQAGLLWGAYHWGTAAPVEDQVQNFFDWARPDAHTLVALDFEAAPGNQMSLDGARQFCQSVFAKLGRRPVLYSGNTLRSALGQTVDTFFGSHRLWLSQYSDSPTVQRSWSTFWLWQYTDGTSGPGLKAVPGLPGNRKGELDCNFFAGSPEELREQWAGP